MAAALALLQLNVHDRDLYLFDTFQVMPKPEAVDVDFGGGAAMDMFHQQQIGEDGSENCLAELADVQTNMARTSYDPGRIHFVPGKVEDSIPGQAPETIALLRLDTDWYSSTRHELEHLFPRLSPGGILIVDDYGHWEGARKATDEYLSLAPDVVAVVGGPSPFDSGKIKTIQAQAERRFPFFHIGHAMSGKKRTKNVQRRVRRRNIGEPVHAATPDQTRLGAWRAGPGPPIPDRRPAADNRRARVEPPS